MIQKRCLVRGLVVLSACVLVPVALSAAGTPGPRITAGFTLAANGGEPAPIPFNLAPLAADPAGGAGPSGLGIIEDAGAPYRTALGYNALYYNNSGLNNTAVGYQALFNSTGSDNTAVGANALLTNIDGIGNTAIGANAIGQNAPPGSYNTATGTNALFFARESYNTANGAFALLTGQWANHNTAMGYRALPKAGADYANPSVGNTAVGSLALENLIGISWEYGDGPISFNTALGYGAGSSVVRGEHNIFIGANQTGAPTDTNTIRIGTSQNLTYIAGIAGTPLTSGDSPSVVGITSEGRLGTMSTDLLPEGPQGPQGIPGPRGPAGEGLVTGSLLYLVAGFSPPAGYAFLGTTELGLIDPVTKKANRIKVNVYQKL